MCSSSDRVCGDFWASLVEIRVFPRPTCGMLTSVSGEDFGEEYRSKSILVFLSPTAYMYVDIFRFFIINLGHILSVPLNNDRGEPAVSYK